MTIIIIILNILTFFDVSMFYLNRNKLLSVLILSM